MQISKQDEDAIRKRIKDADTTLVAVAGVGGITLRVVTKLMSGENVRQQTYDAFMSGLEQLEVLKESQRAANSNRAQHRQPALAVA